MAQFAHISSKQQRRGRIAGSRSPSPQRGRPVTADWFLAPLRHDRAVVLAASASSSCSPGPICCSAPACRWTMMDMGGGQMMVMLPRMDARLRPRRVRHVGGDDGGDDAAERRAGDPADRRHRPQRAGRQSGRPADGTVRCRLSRACGSPSPRSRHCCNGSSSEAGLLSRDDGAGQHRSSPARVLVAAGIYQWTPLKQACLRHCRSPLEFLLFHWRDGAAGALDQRRAARRCSASAAAGC